VLVGIVAVGLVVPAYMTVVGSLSTDIIGTRCLTWIVHASTAAKNAKNVATVSITYLLPLMMMTFFYARISYALTHKVVIYLELYREKNI